MGDPKVECVLMHLHAPRSCFMQGDHQYCEGIVNAGSYTASQSQKPQSAPFFLLQPFLAHMPVRLHHLPHHHSFCVKGLALLPHKSWLLATEPANMAVQHSADLIMLCVRLSCNNHALLVHGVWLYNRGGLLIDYLGALLPHPGLSLRM